MVVGVEHPTATQERPLLLQTSYAIKLAVHGLLKSPIKESSIKKVAKVLLHSPVILQKKEKVSYKTIQFRTISISILRYLHKLHHQWSMRK